VSFTSITDPLATLPAPYTFTTVDTGQHAFPLTLRTAGIQNVTVADVPRGLSTLAAFAVSPASGAVCTLTDLQPGAVPGALIGAKVTVKDAFANIATGYAGTVALSSSDAAARFSPPAAFTALDSGSRAFSARLNTTGLQTITATDSLNAFSCQGSVNIVAGPSFSVGFGTPDAWAGTPVTATITALDNSGNVVPTYAGTIAFTSSDPAAVKPANVTLTGTEGGTVNVNVTFNTIGLQTFTATDTATTATTGTGTQTVHGLVYTNPPAGGKVRLVANASSSASLVRLDLVSNATLATVRSAVVEAQLGCAATACSRRNGAFGAGVNLPLDINKVGPDTTLISVTPPSGSTAVLTLGPAPQAVGALLNTTTGVLYSGISQKRAEVAGATTTLRGDANVSPFPGAFSFYYSLRLRLIPGAAVGTVFDGANLGSKFRAAIRDRSGSDVFSNPDFALGKLEVR